MTDTIGWEKTEHLRAHTAFAEGLSLVLATLVKGITTTSNCCLRDIWCLWPLWALHWCVHTTPVPHTHDLKISYRSQSTFTKSLYSCMMSFTTLKMRNRKNFSNLICKLSLERLHKDFWSILSFSMHHQKSQKEQDKTVAVGARVIYIENIRKSNS